MHINKIKPHRALFSSKLGRKLIRCFLFVGLMPLLFFIIFISGAYKSEFFNKTAKDFKNKNVIISSKIFEDIASRKQEIDFISAVINLKINNLNPDTYALKMEIDESFKRYSKFSNISVFNYKNNNLVYSTGSDSSIDFINVKKLDLKKSIYIKQYKTQNTLVFPDIFIYLSVLQEDTVSFVIIGKLNKDYLWEISTSQYIPSGADIVVLDENNIALLHTFSDSTTERDFFKLLQGKMKKNSEVTILNNSIFEERLISYYKIYMKGSFGIGNWAVILSQKSEETMKPVKNLIKTLIILSIVSILFMLLLSLILTRQIVEPITILADKTMQVARGNLNFSIDYKGSDEITDLINSFNKMTSSLKTTTFSKNYIYSILNSINDIIIVIDSSSGNILNVNSRINILGFEPKEINNKNISTLFDEKHNSEFNEKFNVFLKTKDINEFTGYFITKNNTKIPVGITFSFLIDPDNPDSQKIIISARDIRNELRMIEEKNKLLSDLRVSYEKLKNTQNQLIQSEKMAAIGTLAAGIAHEVNNPSAYIKWNIKHLKKHYAELAEFIEFSIENNSGNKNDMVKRYEELKIDSSISDLKDILVEVESGIDKIIYIIKNMNIYAHPGSEQIQKSDINQLIKNALQIVESSIKYKVDIISDFTNIPPVECDPQQLSQVFMNIIMNAAQAIETRGKIEISTSYNAADKKNIIKISDNGSGIKKEFLSKIFDPFFTTKEVGKGTGLGLNIAYQIVQKFKGEIFVDSDIGKGTTFVISFPADK